MLAIRLIASTLFFANTALYETRQSFSPTPVVAIASPSWETRDRRRKSLTDLPRGEHRSSAAQRAASTRIQLFDSSL